MTIKDALREMLYRRRMMQKTVCEKAGYATVSSLTSILQRNDAHVTTLIRLANAAGYSVMLVNEDSMGTERPIRLELSDEQKEEIANKE